MAAILDVDGRGEDAAVHDSDLRTPCLGRTTYGADVGNNSLGNNIYQHTLLAQIRSKEYSSK